MKKKIFVLGLFLSITCGAFAQNYTDALRYSNINYYGTARFMALSGAYGAVGADLSTLSQNPAGMGLYRRSEFTVTPSVVFNKTESEFLGNKTDKRAPYFNLNSIGYVHTIIFRDPKSKLKTLQFGIGVNKLADFNNKIYLTGFNDKSSFLTPYVNQANAANKPAEKLNDFTDGLAYDVNLLYKDKNTNLWAIDMPNGQVQQTKYVETTGGLNETVLSAAANIQDKFYVGLTVGLPEIDYTYSSKYIEEDIKNINSNFNSFIRNEYLETKGYGVNAKIGLIYKPVDELRLGLAFHTPTYFYSMKDYYWADMTSHVTFDKKDYFKQSPESRYEYTLTTPMRLIASATYLIQQKGLISADYEFVDYSTARFDASDYNFQRENDDIKGEFKAGHNFRIGAEWNYDIFAFRGGYRFSSTPYKNGEDLGIVHGISVGAGIHMPNYFIDLSYNRFMSKDDYYLYQSTAAKNTWTNNVITATLGLKF